MNGKACAGTGEQVHLIIFTCARHVHEVRARRKNEEGIKRMRIAGEKDKWREDLLQIKMVFREK